MCPKDTGGMANSVDSLLRVVNCLSEIDDYDNLCYVNIPGGAV